MDKTVMIVGAIAIIAILAFTLIMNPFAGPATSSQTTDTAAEDTSTDQQTTEEPPEEEDKPSHVFKDDGIDYINATYGEVVEEVEGDCGLYQHIVSDRFECFGTSGAYQTTATNDYKEIESEKYFCKATEFGCKLYEKVTHAIWTE